MDVKQLEVIRTAVAMFKAAPGANYLSELFAFIKNTGGSVKELANILTQIDVFKQSLYSDTLSNHAFASQFVENTVDLLVSEEDKSWAASEIEKMLDAGESRGEVIHWAATVLASINPSNTHWGAAAQQFNTKQPPAKAGGFELRTESPDTRRLNDASYSGSILKLSFGFGSK